MTSAILFDLDETLVDRATTIHLLARRQHRAFPDLLAGISAEEFVEKFVEYDDKGRTHKREMFNKLGEHFRLTEATKSKLFEDRDSRVPGCTSLYEGAHDCLAQVRSFGFRLGLISNGRACVQIEKMKAAGIERYFDEIVVSDVEGIEKPHPDIFLRTLARLGADCRRSIFVGDDPEKDIYGARNVNLKTIFIQTRNHAFCTEADRTVSCLGEVPAAVEQLLGTLR